MEASLEADLGRVAELSSMGYVALKAHLKASGKVDPAAVDRALSKQELLRLVSGEPERPEQPVTWLKPEHPVTWIRHTCDRRHWIRRTELMKLCASSSYANRPGGPGFPSVEELAGMDPALLNGQMLDWHSTPLCLAADSGHVLAVERLLAAKADPNCLPVKTTRDGGGSRLRLTPLHFAVRSGFHSAVPTEHRARTVRALLEASGRDLNVRCDRSGATALSHAVQCKTRLSVRQLLACPDIDPDLPDHDGVCPLLHAVLLRSEQMVAELLDPPGRLNVNFTCAEVQHRTALHLASTAPESRWDMLGWLLNQPAVALDPADLEGRTPLMYAAISGQIHAASRLIDAGAQINLCDSPTSGGQPRTALDYASKHQHTELSRLLAERGAVSADLVEQLHAAAARQDQTRCVELIEAGVDLHSLDADGRSPLVRAASNGWVDSVRIVLNLADQSTPEANCAQIRLAMVAAVQASDVEMARCILDHPAVDPKAACLGETVEGQLGGLAINPEVHSKPVLLLVIEQSPRDGEHAARLLSVCQAVVCRCPQSVDQLVSGRDTVLVLARGSPNNLIRQWASAYGSYLGRYKLLAEQPEHKSATCEVWRAQDTIELKEVALKIVAEREHFESEVLCRVNKGGSRLDDSYVLDLVRTHVPPGFVSDYVGQTVDWLVDASHCSTEESFVLCMPWADRNLAQIAVMERVAGISLDTIMEISAQFARGLQYLHQNDLIHGDAKPRNVVRINGRFKLIDLDASASFDQPCGKKFSEAYVPPEFMRLLLPTRAQHKGLSKHPHPTIPAKPSFDIWQFGVVLFELLSGADLFPKDFNDDTICLAEDCHKLATWTEPPPEKLDLVLRSASATPVRLMMARDLLSLCLQGSEENRPASMCSILAHPFFCAPDLPIASLPSDMRLPDTVDVVFSYQSTQVVFLRRIRRALNALGIATADGTQVPAGHDWRAWYFSKANKAALFIPICSPNLFRSSACFEEALWCMNMNKPVIRLNYDQPGFDGLMNDPGNKRNSETQGQPGYRSMLAGCPAVPELGQFDLGFFANLKKLVDVIIGRLPERPRPRIHLVCAPDPQQREFSSSLSEKLCAQGFDARVLDAAAPDQPAEVCLPVISGGLLQCPNASELLQLEQENKAQWLPVLYDISSFYSARSCYKDSPDTALRVPHLLSILNTANRTPPSSNFTDNYRDNFDTLLAALRRLVLMDRQPRARLAHYLPKFSTILHGSPKLPSSGILSPDCFDDSMDELMGLIRPIRLKEALPHNPAETSSSVRGPVVVVSHTSAKIELLRSVVEFLKGQGLTVIFHEDPDPLEWFDDCDDASVCLLWITRDFVATACGLNSQRLQSQMTFAKDNRLQLIPLMAESVRLEVDYLLSNRGQEMQDLMALLQQKEEIIQNQQSELRRLQQLRGGPPASL